MKKLKLDIKGKFQQVWTNLVLKRKARSLGVKVELVKHHSIHHGEVILSGDSNKLWKVINSTRAPRFLFKLDRVVFEFSD